MIMGDNNIVGIQEDINFNDVRYMPESASFIIDILNDSEVIVADIDEVLTDISLKLYDFMYLNRDKYGKFYDLENYDLHRVNNRSHAFINAELQLSNSTEAHNSLMKYLTNFPYNLAGVNPIVEVLIDTLTTNKNKRLYVLSTTLGPTLEEDGIGALQKMYFINRLFEGVSDQVTYLPVYWDKSETKSEVWNRDGEETFDIFIDDDMKNIEDMMLNTEYDANHIKLFFIPKFSYNQKNFNEVAGTILSYRTQLLWYDKTTLELKPENPRY